MNRDRGTRRLAFATIAVTVLSGILWGPATGVLVAAFSGALVGLCAFHAPTGTPPKPTRPTATRAGVRREGPTPPTGIKAAKSSPTKALPEPHSETGQPGAAPLTIPPAPKQPAPAKPAKLTPSTTSADEKTDLSAESTPAFDFDAFRRELFFAEDAWDQLRQTVGAIRTREAEGGEEATTAVERFLARLLTEAGLLDGKHDEELPYVRVVRPHHSGMFYLRADTSRISYGSYLRILRIEAALNALLFAHDELGDLNAARMEDLYKVNQRVLANVCAQTPVVDTADWSYLAMPWQAAVGPSERGEWAVRQALSDAVESVRVPFRLEASFRVNVAEGDVAIEISATPPRVFFRSAYVSGLGIVPTTTQMRQREASSYAARLALMLASHAFDASEHVRRVWVSAIHETPAHRSCLYSGCIDRRDFAQLNLRRRLDALATLRRLGVAFNEVDGALMPIQPTFYLEDERFCPPRRHDLWRLSERALPASAALSLGANRVSGLLIHEELPRTLAADEMLRNLAAPGDRHAVEHSVRAILDVAEDTSDLSVWNAAERVVGKIVDGTLGIDDPSELHDELVEGDALSKAVHRAQALLMQQEPMEAFELLRDTLEPLERTSTYRDTQSVAYRSFGSFAERVLFNRMNERDKRSVVLVPDSYVMAHMILSALLTAYGAQQDDAAATEQAINHARRAVELAPLSAPAALGLAACLEQAERYDEAAQSICDLLEVAFSHQAIAFAYYRLASVEWHRGNHEACQACYLCCIRVMPAFLPRVIAECQALMMEGAQFVDHMDEKTVDDVLESNGIPLAPTQRTSFILYDGATASVDAEVFPVARDLVAVLESLTGDDVIRGIRSSLEREPDA